MYVSGKPDPGLPGKPDFNDVAPVGIYSGGGDFQFRGFGGQSPWLEDEE